MVNPLLVQQLLRELEKEKGCPVQLTVDTPGTLGERAFFDGRSYLGDLKERALAVRRVKGLKRAYLPDVLLIEWEYENLGKLEQRICWLNALHTPPVPDSLAERAYCLVDKGFKGYLESLGKSGKSRKSGKPGESSENLPPSPGLILNSLAHNFREKSNPNPRHGGFRGISPAETYALLEDARITYLRHNLVARLDGVYDYGARNELAAGYAVKVADVALELVK